MLKSYLLKKKKDEKFLMKPPHLPSNQPVEKFERGFGDMIGERRERAVAPAPLLVSVDSKKKSFPTDRPVVFVTRNTFVITHCVNQLSVRHPSVAVVVARSLNGPTLAFSFNSRAPRSKTVYCNTVLNCAVSCTVWIFTIYSNSVSDKRQAERRAHIYSALITRNTYRDQ